MKSNKDILASVLKTTQMGQVGIRAVLPYAVKSDFKKALTDQKNEYEAIENEAHSIAFSRGWELNELDPVAKVMSKTCARSCLAFGRADSKIAAMMINGNTRGMIKGLKNLHHGVHEDQAVTMLAEKLLRCEESNIKSMQGYV